MTGRCLHPRHRISRARTKIGFASFVYNMQRVVRLIEQAAPNYPFKTEAGIPIERYHHS